MNTTVAQKTILTPASSSVEHLTVAEKIIFEHQSGVPIPEDQQPKSTKLFFSELAKIETQFRVYDVIIASFLLVLMAPVTLLSLLLIKVTDGGPVFIRKTFTGFRGRTFQASILRTRVHVPNQLKNTELTGTDFPPRTGIGKVLEFFALERIPLLFAVLRGDMSMVGIRLRTELEANRLCNTVAWYYKLHAFYPGFYSWAGLHTKQTLQLEDQLDKDLYFVAYRHDGMYFKGIFRGLLGLR